MRILVQPGSKGGIGTHWPVRHLNPDAGHLSGNNRLAIIWTMPWNPDTLKRLRERQGWSQVELGRRVKAHQVTIARLETGVRQPGIDLLERLAKALKVKVTDLLK